ncbi:MAG: TlpA family protein disulfide reductase [Candidatus Symbiothrix sp.]|jgi:thiol-disulfide isomerase/thioredoxin|nr:TlpA family protein disulfide reductase [Candidatus Symbiothrix sp.]
MKKAAGIFVLFLTLASASFGQNGTIVPIQCVLKGEVVNRPQSSCLILLKAGEDARTAEVIYIPIKDGKFEYIFRADAEEAYQFLFDDEHRNGSWRPIDFIVEQGTLNFVLHPIDETDKNVVEGGRYTNEYLTLEKEIANELKPLYDSLSVKYELLEKEGKTYTPEAINLLEEIDKLAKDDPKKQQLWEQWYKWQNERKHLTPEAKAVEDEFRNTDKKSVEKKIQYAKDHPNIVGYTLLVKNIREGIEYRKEDVSPLLKIYRDIYQPKYSHHPYTALIESYVNAESVKVGNRYVDVTAVDKDDKEVKLSELIKGKVALIHLWASWCGPCRRHGKEMIPIYEQYKDKGFTVVGIARERNKNAMLTAIEKDKYPWANLLELNDQHEIWTQFGIGNAGGGEFLVDENGVFLAIGATSEEISEILGKYIIKK